jgi:acetolactate synthase-1/2/3 large subunit
MATTAALVAKTLADAGIDRVFGLPGGEVLVLIDELRRAGIDFVLMRHEANAGLAAAVYGKLRGQPGVVLTTLGPGAANLMLPIASAHLEQEPLLALSAQIPDDFPPSHTHQLLPLHEVYQPLCRYVQRITADTATAVVSDAITQCMRRPYAPSYLTLSAREALRVEEHGGTTAAPATSTALPAADATSRCADRLTRALSQARRPIVLVGLGIDSANGALLRAWLQEWNLPVAVTPKVKGIVDETAANFVGVISGMAADDLMCEALAAADLRIGFGLDPVEVDKTWHDELSIEWVLEAPNAVGITPPGVDLVDHTQLLETLIDRSAPASWDAPFARYQYRRAQLLEGRSAADSSMWPGDIVRALASAVPKETIVTTDVGSHKYLFGQFWPSREPNTFWMSNGLSGMAYGLSAAIGAKLARPGAPVLAAIGDGGFAMNSQELETSERIGAPFITVVFEDGSYSLIKLSQENKKLAPYRMDFNPIDTVKVAEACGVDALRTSDPRELEARAREAAARNTSLVIAVPVNYQDYRRMF